MWSIIIALALGIGLGYFRLLPKQVLRFTSTLTTGGVMLLLFLMGAQIGSNEELLSGLGQMGIQALLYATAAIVGSIIAVKILESVVSLDDAAARQRGEGE